jgi:DMSO reductase anchor subunit
MHPAFSVIFFTTFSGAGFGLLAWLGVLALAGGLPSRAAALVLLALGALLAASGLVSSLLHLGKPARAWRAFSQWRSSWLSREGLFAVATFGPVLWLAWLFWTGALVPVPGATPALLHLAPSTALRIAGLLLTALAYGSVTCTAMIYASLTPVPAWTHPLVLPVYLLFALLTGGLLACAVIALAGDRVHPMAALAAILGAATLWRFKRLAWRSIDAGRMPATRNEALGLPHARAVRVFERPHTEANYLLREMGYVLARRHARRLRLLALLLFALLPALLALPVWMLPGAAPAPWMLAAALSALLGAFVERWLFFAEARHLVTLYY